MSRFEYLAIIESIFSEDGALVQVGARHNPQQQQYALHVAEAISRDQSVGFCEAGTGIGKSIAYLIPALVYLSKHKGCSPIAISTHTRALQRQLTAKDIPLASAAIRQYGLDVPMVAYRMGRQAFFSPTRVQEFVESMDDDQITAAHKDFVRFVSASAMSGTGLWLDYIDEYHTLPAGISIDDVTLLDVMTSDNPAYDRHIEEAKQARLLITNHSSILSRHVFVNKSFHALICDEAHEIEEVCKGFSAHKSQLSYIKNAAMATTMQSKTVQSVVDLADTIAQALSEFDQSSAKKQTLLTDISHNDLLAGLQGEVLALNKALRSVQKRYAKSIDDAPTIKQAKILKDLDSHVDTLKAFEVGTDRQRRRAIGFSQVNRKPSIASVSLNAGMLFNYRANLLTKRIVLVSASMSDASSKNLSFNKIASTLGIHTDRITDQCSISPKQFGEMTFVVVPHGKSPVRYYEDSEDTVCFDPLWIDTTVSMIEAAAMQGKTLVLSPSIKESKLLAKKLGCDHLLQDHGTSLLELTSAFINSDYPILLSAGAWTGVSFRDNQGGQLIKNVVITRIPFAPKDDTYEFLQREYLLSKGYPLPKIKSIFWQNQQYHAMLRLKQGVGRGIRDPKDKVKVWFSDPRMPTQSKSSGLIAAIPSRFLDNYYAAEVFEADGLKDATPLVYL